MSVLAIGVGNPFRHDDAAGIEVARRLRDASVPGLEIHVSDGEPSRLIDLWKRTDTVYLFDAMAADEPPGTLHRIEIGDEPLPDHHRGSSTHAVQLGEVIELARALDRLPRRLVVIGIVGQAFHAGVGLTRAVERTAVAVAAQLIRETRSSKAGGDR